MKTIQIPVSDELAAVYDSLMETNRRTIQALLRLRLEELLRGANKPLSTIMNEIGAAAELAGLTDEVLDSLLHQD